MENPATWGMAERIIADEMEKAHADTEAGMCGASVYKRIADRLREAGLLVDAKTGLTKN